MNKKDNNTIPITISIEVYDNLYSLANMLKASGSKDGGLRSYDKAIRYALIQARLWDVGKINTSHDMFFCYDLGISLTANDCCHEDSCSYAAECLLMKPLLYS